MPASATTKTALGARAGKGFDSLRSGDDPAGGGTGRIRSVSDNGFRARASAAAPPPPVPNSAAPWLRRCLDGGFVPVPSG
jgi:hypothetical protein